MIGAYYKNRLLGTDYQLSWVRKNRKPVSYKVPGQFTEKTITLSSLQGQLVGLDVSRSLTDKLTLFIRAEGTILNQEEKKLDTDRFTFDRFEASADFKPNKKMMFTGQYFFRKPRQNLNSIFSIFSNSDSRELWFNVFVYPISSLSVFGGWAAVDYDYDDTNRYNAGFVWKYITVSANKFKGYSGDMDNITGSLQVPVRSNLWVRGSLSSGRYKLYEDAADYNNMVTSSFGATFTPRKTFTIDIEGQGIRNELSSSDFRLFGRINYWFFTKR